MFHVKTEKKRTPHKKKLTRDHAIEDVRLVIDRMQGLPAPKVVMEVIACKCSRVCKTPTRVCCKCSEMCAS